MMSRAELSARSAFSCLEGASSLEALDGTACRLVRDGATGAWTVDAIYD
jgi:hypothetical protein